ncbi:MAG: hypothetical protein GWN01_16830 [Nitrosopumilaceae archaeon]|nr:hypothetical protein [Nitrosopumilaceae archaeon]NIU02499.1 hypothetical protein [Nitrosopumilaceae archaeon]NIU88960.1 hypothetical protein [Nitrosopumilaceae archaeon]NIV67071.1 hypothetical protein [Nitrosopumilaceae archaeon]NIX63100.1 hypothetical protein [Nitrosopumilaceae archaeon]
MSRQRYWKLTTEEVEKLSYNEEKLLNWDIKCTLEPEEDAQIIGVFQYKEGTPLDYEEIKGITCYHNNLSKELVSKLTSFLKEKVGGEELEKGSRIFFQNSKELYSGKDIAALAKELEEKFNAEATITLEFQNLTQEEMNEGGLPDAKLLPIPGK